MLAAMACLVVVPPICPHLPALSHILNHRLCRPRLHTHPSEVSRRVRSSITAGPWPGAIVVDIPRGAWRCQGGRV